MTSIKITFLSPFHKFSGEREFEVEFKEGDTFGDLVKKLGEKFGDEFKETILDENNRIEDWISVMKNGRNIGSKPDSGFSEMLEKDDEFIFCAFISGG
jgi:molybdopterin converting factor small subunit